MPKAQNTKSERHFRCLPFQIDETVHLYRPLRWNSEIRKFIQTFTPYMEGNCKIHILQLPMVLLVRSIPLVTVIGVLFYALRRSVLKAVAP